MPLGVDLIEIQRAKLFYKNHRKNLKSILNQEETEYLESGNRHERLAVLLASKEAVFKAIDGSRSGINTFQDIQIFPNNKFSFAVRKRISQKITGLKLSVLKNKRFVIVRCEPT